MDIPDLFNPFVLKTKIHIRIQQRTGRKTITSIEGFDKYETEICTCKILVQNLKKKFSCGGSISNEKIIFLNGDHRTKVKNFLLERKLCEEGDIIIHGY